MLVLRNSCGTVCSHQIFRSRDVSFLLSFVPPYLNTSAGMPSGPAALPDDICRVAFETSARLGVSDMDSRTGHCSMLCYAILNVLDIRVKFRDDSFIGCQDMHENVVHWFWGYKWGDRPLKWNCTLWIYLPPKHVLWCIDRQPTFYGLLCRRVQGSKK